MDAVARSASRTAAALAGLAAAAALHPLAGVAALACGAGLVARRRRLLRGKGRPYALKLGTGTGSRKPVELSRTDACRGILASGSAGSGRTAFLLGLSERAVVAGSGLLYVDGTGDPGMLGKMAAIARLHGREDDLLVLDMTVGENAWGRTHTLNPLASGSADGAVQALFGMTGLTRDENAMWQGRAVALLVGLVGALTWMRDERGLRPHLGTLRERFPLREVIRLANGSGEPGLPHEVRQSLDGYLSGLPGYDSALGEEQPGTVRDQHGYLEMLLETSLGRLVEVHARVFLAGVPDVDMADVVRNRRILIVLLPKLWGPNEGAAIPARAVVAMLKRAMAESFHGVDDDLVPAPAEPFVCVLDEYGHYAVDGFADMARTAGRHGFAAVYGAESLPTLKRLHEREAAAVEARTATKVFTHAVEMWVTSGPAPKEGFQSGMDPTEGEIRSLLPGMGIVAVDGRRSRARLASFDLPHSRRRSLPEGPCPLVVLPEICVKNEVEP